MPFPVASLLIAAAGAAQGGIVYAGGAWAAIDRGAECEALSRSVRIAAKGKVQALAGFTFSADRRRWGEFHARLSRLPRANAAVMLKIGDQPFLLVSRGGWAWSKGPVQEQANIETRDQAGRRYLDSYRLDGAPTAIDAAAARCAGKKARP